MGRRRFFLLIGSIATGKIIAWAVGGNLGFIAAVLVAVIIITLGSGILTIPRGSHGGE